MTEPARLADHKLLGGFSPEEVNAVAAVASARTLGAGEPVWECGAESSGLFLILRGKVELSRATEFPERRVVMGIFGEGSVVGETLLFGATGQNLTALAMGPVELAEISPEALEKLESVHPAAYARLLRAVLKVVSRRLVQAYERMSSVF